MKRISLATLATLATLTLSACVSQADLSDKYDDTVINYAENYQVIYKRVVDQAKACQSGQTGIASALMVDAQLYPDLGFGDIAVRLSNLGTNTYFYTAKVSKNGSGSTFTITGAPRVVKQVVGWANGSKKCNGK